MAVADRGDAEPRREVEVAVAVDVEDVRSDRLRPHHARPARDGVDAGRFARGEDGGELARERAWRSNEDLGREVARSQPRTGRAMAQGRFAEIVRFAREVRAIGGR